MPVEISTHLDLWRMLQMWPELHPMTAASKQQGQFNEKERRLQGLWNLSPTTQNIWRGAFLSGSIIMGNISCLTSRQAAPCCGCVTFSVSIITMQSLEQRAETCNDENGEKSRDLVVLLSVYLMWLWIYEQGSKLYKHMCAAVKPTQQTCFFSHSNVVRGVFLCLGVH